VKARNSSVLSKLKEFKLIVDTDWNATPASRFFFFTIIKIAGIDEQSLKKGIQDYFSSR